VFLISFKSLGYIIIPCTQPC